MKKNIITVYLVLISFITFGQSINPNAKVKLYSNDTIFLAKISELSMTVNSGTTTPTPFNAQFCNVTILTDGLHYIRVGNIVNFTIKGTISALSGTATSFEIPLPIPSVFTGSGVEVIGFGTGFSPTNIEMPLRATIPPSGNSIRIFRATNSNISIAGGFQFEVTGSYIIK